MQRSHDEEIRSEAFWAAVEIHRVPDTIHVLMSNAREFENYLYPKVANINTEKSSGDDLPDAPDPQRSHIHAEPQASDNMAWFRTQAPQESDVAWDEYYNKSAESIYLDDLDPGDDIIEGIGGAWVWVSDEEEAEESNRPPVSSNVSIFVYGEFDPEAIADVINRVSNGDSSELVNKI